MTVTKRSFRAKRAGVAGIAALALVGLAGCGEAADEAGNAADEAAQDVTETETSETSTTPAESETGAVDDGEGEVEGEMAYDGVYDIGFYDSIEAYEYQEVTVKAKVNSILSDNGFTIAGTEDTTVDEMLIIHEDPIDGLTEDAQVKLSGTVRLNADIPKIGQQIGEEENLEAFQDYSEEPYIIASDIQLVE